MQLGSTDASEIIFLKFMRFIAQLNLAMPLPPQNHRISGNL